MAVDRKLSDLSLTKSSNTPAGTDVVGSDLDDFLRDLAHNITLAARMTATATASANTSPPVTVMNKVTPVDTSGGSTLSVSLVAAATAGDGFQTALLNLSGSAPILVHGDSGDTIDGASTYSLAGAYEVATFACDGSNWHVVASAKGTVLPRATVTGDATVGGALVVVGAATFDDSVTFSSTALFKAAVTMNSGLTVDGTLSASGTAVFGKKIVVSTTASVAALTVGGVALTATQLQIQSATDATNNSITATIPLDDTIPQSSEGEEIVTVAITPAASTSSLKITFGGFVSGSGNLFFTSALFLDSETGARYATTQVINASGQGTRFGGEFIMDSPDTSEHTFKLRCGVNGGTAYLNGSSSGRFFGGKAATYLIVEEIG